MFSAKLIFLASALVAATLAADTPNGRQFLAADLQGEYELFVKQGSCAPTVTLNSFNRLANGAYAIPHSEISENGVACAGTGSLTVITREAIVDSGNEPILETPPLSNVVNTLNSQGATFLLGFEREARVCGSFGTSANSIIIFVDEEKRINIPGLITLFPGAKYMIVYEPSSPTPCTYFAQNPDRIIGTGTAPRPTVTPEPSEELAQETAEAVVAPGDTEEDKEVIIAGGPIGSASESNEPEVSEAGAEGSAAGGSDTGFGTGPIVTDFEEDASESPEPSSEEDDGSTCFPEDATVELEDGRIKRMDEIDIGERVRVGTNEFSEVFMFTHRMSKVENGFVQLEMESGLSLSVTKGHYIYVNERLITAETAKVGDEVQEMSGMSKITKVSMVRGRGLYNPQTVHGDIVVNGVKASTYTTAVKKMTAHSLLTPVRAAFRVLGVSTQMLEKGGDRLANLMPSGDIIAA